MRRGAYTVNLAQGDVARLRVVHEGARAWIAIFDRHEQDRPLIQAQLSREEGLALTRAIEVRE